MTEDQMIRDGQKVEQFLNDEAVKAALARVRAERLEAVAMAARWEDSRDAWYALKNLDAFETALRATVGNGEKAKRDREHRERVEQATKRRGQ